MGKIRKQVKRFLFSVALGGGIALWTYNSFANAKIEYALLDTDFLHTYKDKDGIWIVPAKEKKKVEKILEELEIPEKDFLELNQLKSLKQVSKSKAYFFPYSSEYVEKLKKEGLTRELVESHQEKMVWPIALNKPAKVTSRIGRRWNRYHTGIDIACKPGTMVLAAADGIVEKTGWIGHYGKAIHIYHPKVSHTVTVYAHNSHILVEPGDKVRKGQLIAFSGNTGRSTGPHLHFEVRYQNIFLNPEHFLPELPDSTEIVAQALD